MRQTMNGKPFFAVMALLMLFSSASWARYGGQAYEQAADFQEETGQMLAVYQNYLGRRPHADHQRYEAIEHQLDRLDAKAAMLTRNLDRGKTHQAQELLRDSRHIASNTVTNLNSVQTSRKVRRQWRSVQNALNEIDLTGTGRRGYSTSLDDRPVHSAYSGFDGNFDEDDELEAYSRDHSRHGTHAEQQYYTDLTGLVDQVEDLSEKVKNTFRKTSKRKQSWEKTLDSKLSGFDQKANQLRDSWKSSHSADRIRPIVRSLKQQAASIDSLMTRHPVNAGVRAHWSNLKSKLNQLSVR